LPAEDYSALRASPFGSPAGDRAAPSLRAGVVEPTCLLSGVRIAADPL